MQCVWECRLRNGSHVVSASMCWQHHSNFSSLSIQMMRCGLPWPPFYLNRLSKTQTFIFLFSNLTFEMSAVHEQQHIRLTTHDATRLNKYIRNSWNKNIECDFPYVKLTNQLSLKIAGGMWLIHCTKHHKDNQLQILEFPCRISQLRMHIWH